MSKNQEIAEREEKRKNWDKRCQEARNKEEPLHRHCRLIKGLRAPFEMTFEEYEELQAETEKTTEEKLKEENERDRRKNAPTKLEGNMVLPDGMTKTKWPKQQRRIRKQARDEERQRQADSDFVYKMAPLQIFEREISDNTYECACTPESIRQGEFCPICRLIAPIRKDMWSLFKDVAEGRSRDTE